MSDRSILRKQYLKQRRTVMENFRQSQTNIPVVGDDIIYGIPNFRGLYSKGFTGHTGPNGLVIHPNIELYSSFIEGIKNRERTKINQVCSFCPRLADPFCILDVELEGKYKSTFGIPLPPHPLSNQAAAELLEVYAMALLREYDLEFFNNTSFLSRVTSPNGYEYAIQILVHLNDSMVNSNLNGPRANRVNNNLYLTSLFRGNSQGDLIGPYISQFFYYESAVGNYILDQKYFLLPNNGDQLRTDYDFGKTEEYFRDLWNGVPKSSNLQLNFRYLRTIRDLAIYINRDQIWQPFFVTATILLNRGVPTGFYTSNRRTDGGRFINLGVVDLYTLMMKAVKLAMNATWVWKWCQLKQRPEELAYQVHISKLYPDLSLDFPNFLMNSPILTKIFEKHGKYLMPLAYSNGSPCHPSYPAGHATIAGAMSTILKAWFNCDSMMTSVIASEDGQSLLFYKGWYETITRNNSILDKMYLNIGHELDKMASNCSYSRCMAGIHYRSDCESGILLGEKVAIELLKDEVLKYDDNIAFQFRKRNGEVVKIANHNQQLTPAQYPTNAPRLIYNKNTEFEYVGDDVFTYYKNNFGLEPIYSKPPIVIELSGATDNPTQVPNIIVSPILSS